MSVQADSSIDIEVLAEFEAALEERTRELAEAHAREAASAEILRVIASSPADSQPVFDAIVRSGAKLFPDAALTIGIPEGDKVVAVAIAEPDRARAESWRSRFPVPLTRAYLHGVCILDGKVVDIPDVTEAPAELALGANNFFASGYRAITMVPLVQGNAAIGALSLVRPVAGAITNEQLALLEAFAAQAVIAIENTRLFAEVSESLAQQTATADVLKVISRSTFDLQSVLNTLVKSAAKLCDAYDAVILLREGDVLKAGAHHGPIEYEFDRLPVGRGWVSGRCVADGRAVHVDDLAAAGEEYPEGAAMAARSGHRTTLAIPLLRQGEAIGALMIRRREVRPFSQRQIDLLRVFADQAVIAIENVRLFEAEQQRTNELRESLDRHTATADILKVIAASPTDVQPVFDAIAQSATRLLSSQATVVTRVVGDEIHLAALTAGSEDGIKEVRGSFPSPLSSSGIHSRVARSGTPAFRTDIENDPEVSAEVRRLARARGYRSILVVPMLRDGVAIGTIGITRREPGAFTDTQIDLLRTFADQAVIAIENVRLFDDVQRRTEELTESLEQQTATSEVLQVISASPGALQPVFDTMLSKATELCEAGFGTLWLLEGADRMRTVAIHGDLPQDYRERWGVGAVSKLNPSVPSVRAIKTGEIVHVADLRQDSSYLDRDPLVVSAVDISGVRSLIAIPMVKDKAVVGAITIYRREVKPFTDKQIELVTNFAAQAVIAIENTRLLSELRESLEQQTATSEVLEVISSSPGELELVFDAMLENATRICEAKLGVLFLLEGGVYRAVAVNGDSYYAEWYRREPIVDIKMGEHDGTPLQRLTQTKITIHIRDLRDDEAYIRNNPRMRALVETAGARTHLVVPMIKDEELAGAIVIYRQEVRPFSDKQIAMVKNFAAQAVIAIENARLLNELRESLSQQTATADVLKVIATSPGTSQPVFDTMLASATRLCDASYGAMWLREGDGFRSAALHGALPPEYVEQWRSGTLVRAGPDAPMMRVAQTRRPVQLADMRDSPAYLERDPLPVAAVEVAGVRTLVSVPMFKGDDVVGAITIYRKEVRPFTDKQIDLVQNFAAQAVIAIENTRLLSELRESLEQQMATSEVLRVISSSPGDLGPVFESILKNATAICEAKFATLFRYDGETFFPAAHIGAPAELVEAHDKRGAFKAVPGTVLHSVWQTRTAVQSEDDSKAPKPGQHVIFGGARSTVGVPMIKDETLVGIIVIYRQEVRPFTDKQIELVANFAAQAVIAIENTRLLSELRESLDQQTATSEVLKVISSSPGELKPVFDAMLDNAVRICAANFGTLYLAQDNKYRVAALHNAPPEFAEFQSRRGWFQPTPGAMLERAMLTKQVCHSADAAAEAVVGNSAKVGGARSTIYVPMVKDDALVGTIVIYRQEVRPFTDKQVDLVKNFAAQAVIAIENTRLLKELRQRTDDLTESLEQQTTTAEILGVISKSLDDTQPVFDAIVRSGVRLFSGAAVSIALVEDGMVKAAAVSERDPVRAELWRKRFPFPLTREYMHSAAILDRAILDVPDVEQAPVELAAGKSNFLASGYRAATFVPLIRGEAAIGALSVVRIAPGPLSDKQLSTLKTYASQALIAIENARLLSELRQRTDDLTESLEQQTATSEVLEVISSSPGDLTPVFEAMLANATRICSAGFGTLYLYNGATFEAAAFHNAPAAFIEARKRGPIDPSTNSTLGRAARTKQVAQVLDSIKSEAYLQGDPVAVAGTELGNYRTIVSVPMLKDDRLVGVISIYRQEVREFTEKQIELVSNFAAQAVIAIENARLLNELRQRTDDLTESLEYQTATSEILTVISRSPTDTQPVFDIIGERAEKLCDADVSVVSTVDGELIQLASIHGVSDEGTAALRSLYPLPLEGETITARTARGAAVVHVADVLADPTYDTKVAARAAGYRACLGVPMIRDGRVIGTIFVGRKTPGLYTDSQVQLLKTFADQAVIAIGNVRLFKEVRERTEDLQESLQQQTATADVLKVISRSTFDLPTVLNTLVESAARLCGADKAQILRPSKDEYHFYAAANFGHTAEYNEYIKTLKFMPGREGVVGRALMERKPVHIADVLADADYGYPDLQRLGGFRTHLGIPLLREGNPIGILVLSRLTVRPFDEKQIELLTTFADQAVIAIENVRLFDEVQERTEDLQESLQQQTATGNVLEVISRSAFDLQPVFESVAESAVKLCGADRAFIFRFDGELLRSVVAYNAPPALEEFIRDNPIRPDRSSGAGRAAYERRTVHIPDVTADLDYTFKSKEVTSLRTVLAVPILKGEELLGVILTYRMEVKAFTEKQIALVETFADQAAIAIENVRLFDEVQARTEDLAESLQQQTATADVLKIISRSAFDLKTVLDTLLRSAARLCEADQGTITQRMGDKFFRSVAFGYPQEFMDYVKDKPVELNRDTGTGRALLDSKVTHIPDVDADPDYKWPDAQRLGGYRAMLGVPMLREGEPIGVLTLTRKEPRAFTDKQIELVTTFADQAAIAIENVRLFDEIQEKSHQLEEASKHKSQFLANMSHELRTPLNAILGYTELIADGVYGDTPEKVQTTLKRVITNGKHLLGLINDVLDLSKIEAGQLTLSLADYSMKDVVHNVYGAVEPLAAEKKLNFKVEIAPDLPVGHGDERRLTQVLLNLVGNSIKFTDDGNVIIQASLKDGMFCVAVRDTGPGISEDDQKKLFQEFQQADSSTTKKKGGTGLGLAISKRIIEMHGGRIWLDSKLGTGSTFTFMVPVRADQAKRAA